MTALDSIVLIIVKSDICKSNNSVQSKGLTKDRVIMAVIRIVFKAVDISHSSKSNDLPKVARPFEK